MSRIATILAIALCGCTSEVVHFDGPAPACVEVSRLILPTPCSSLADCPPGTGCTELCPRCPSECMNCAEAPCDPGCSPGYAECRDCAGSADSQPRTCTPSGSIAAVTDSHERADQLARFSIAFEQGIDGGQMYFDRLPAGSHLARCSIYGCPVDAVTLRDDPSRCRVQSFDIADPGARPSVIPPASRRSSSTPVEFTVCGSGDRVPERSAPLTATTFSLICTAYGPSGLIGLSELTPVPAEWVGGWALGSFVESCSSETDGAGCRRPSDLAGLGVCASGLCCVSCASDLDCIFNHGIDKCVLPDQVTDGHAIVGHCQGLCFNGDEIASSCDPDTAGVAPDMFEIYGDLVDQDCDGIVDEIHVDPCDGMQDDMVVTFDPDREGCIDRFEASRGGSMPDEDGDHAGAARSVSMAVPWVNVTALEAAAACDDAGKSLCTHQQWQNACYQVFLDGQGNSCRERPRLECSSAWPFPYGPEYNPEVCHGPDRNSAGPDPTGAHPACAGATGALDIVGNVAEWVIIEDELGAMTGFGIAGGSFASGRADVSCGGLQIPEPGASGPDIGFRCCEIDSPESQR